MPTIGAPVKVRFDIERDRPRIAGSPRRTRGAFRRPWLGSRPSRIARPIESGWKPVSRAASVSVSNPSVPSAAILSRSARNSSQSFEPSMVTAKRRHSSRRSTHASRTSASVILTLPTTIRGMRRGRGSAANQAEAKGRGQATFYCQRSLQWARLPRQPLDACPPLSVGTPGKRRPAHNCRLRWALQVRSLRGCRSPTVR